VNDIRSSGEPFAQTVDSSTIVSNQNMADSFFISQQDLSLENSCSIHSRSQEHAGNEACAKSPPCVDVRPPSASMS